MVDFMQDLGADRFQKYFADSPAAIAYLEANFSNASPELRLALIQGADESNFSLRDWVESLRVIGHWLDGHGLILPLSDQIGYVCCAAESAGSGSTLTYLPSLTSEMLETYGCERAVKQ